MRVKCMESQSSYARGCRCKICTNCHRTYAAIRRRQGIYNPRGRPKPAPVEKKKPSLEPQIRDCLTREQYMLYRGYTVKN